MVLANYAGASVRRAPSEFALRWRPGALLGAGFAIAEVRSRRARRERRGDHRDSQFCTPRPLRPLREPPSRRAKLDTGHDATLQRPLFSANTIPINPYAYPAEQEASKEQATDPGKEEQ